MSVLRSRQNLLVVSIVAAVEPPPMALEAVSVDSGDEPVAAVSALQGLVNPIEPVTGPASALFIAAVLEIPSVQVLDLHGITGEGAMLLFQAAASRPVRDCAQRPRRWRQSAIVLLRRDLSLGGGLSLFAGPVARCPAAASLHL